MFEGTEAEKIQDPIRRAPSLDGAVTRSENCHMRRLFFFALAVAALSGSLAQAQSLGDIARQEEARRKAVSSSGKVYTNESLRAEGAPAVPAQAPPATGADKSASKTADTDKTPASGAAADDGKKDEKYWRKRLETERDQLTRAQTFVEALQSRINGLSADFSAHDDPFQRNQISADRQKALSELDRVRKEIAAHTRAISDIQEEGRRAGVPAAWLR
jgi:hypothetical protein